LLKSTGLLATFASLPIIVIFVLMVGFRWSATKAMPVAIFLGPEFPTLLGGLIGLAILNPATRAGFFVPKSSWDFPEKSTWNREWMGSIQMNHHSAEKNSDHF
jgi:lactate permease